jgi:O-antigen/teichoic acid export membrane protein
MNSTRSLLGKFKINFIGYGYNQLVTIAVQLLLVPFFLKYWGTEKYADWIVLTSIPMMLTLLDFGVSQATASRATMLMASGNSKGAICSLQTAFVFTLAVWILIIALACTIYFYLNWNTFLGLSIIKERDASFIILAMSGYLCVHLLNGPFDALFRTIDRTATGAFLIANRRALDIIISILVLVSNAGPVTLALSMLIGQLGMILLIALIAKYLSPWPIFGVRNASWNEFRIVWKPAIAYAGFPLSQVVTLQGSVQVLNQLAMPSVVVGFTMMRTLMRLVIQLGIVSNFALKPEISRLVGMGCIDKARNFTYRAAILMFGFCFLMYIALVVAGPDIMYWWSHGKIGAERKDLALVGGHALANVVWYIPAAFLIATNKHVKIAMVYGFSSVLFLMIWILLSSFVSPIFGASFFILIPEISVIVYLIYSVYKHRR